MSEASQPLFSDLQLSAPLLQVLQELGYESPSPIQAATIPMLLANRDVLGQAQTGTGKTAAFALPILSRMDIHQRTPQALVLAPTRELAIQVAEAFQRYATHIPGFHVLPIYGGQSYGPQLSALRRGVHVVVGTPGRIIDHLEKGALDLSHLKTMVLDEADEMLRMGFIDDVESILQKTPASRQTTLFSATMPAAVKRIAKTYLRDPAEITVAAKTGTADNIRQRYWLVSGMHKLDALTRILEVEPFDGLIIFARTKLGTEELAGKLLARGFAAAAINGDIQQQQRERTIAQLKDGQIDVLIATDVAARGLDVERISHVINYDVPHDPESYTHRIGRTGRAGRSGEAILFITPREKNLLKSIERSTRQPITQMTLPSIEAVNDVRVTRFKEQIRQTLEDGELEVFRSLIEDFEREQNVPAVDIAAALARMLRKDAPLLLADRAAHVAPRQDGQQRTNREADTGMLTYRIEVGHAHGVKPGNIVGAIANEAGIDSRYIGRIDIRDDFSLLDLPGDLSTDVLEQLTTLRVAGQALRIRRDDDRGSAAPRTPRAERADHGQRARRDEAAVAGARPTKADFAAHVMQTYRIEVGHAHGVKPGNIVGAIANEAGIESRYIGRIEIAEDHSVLDLPGNMPDELLHRLKKVWVAGQQLKISLTEQRTPPLSAARGPRALHDSRADAGDAAARGASAATGQARHGKTREKGKPDLQMQTYRIDVGRAHAVTAAGIVNAIAAEAGLDARHVGRIDIHDDHSTLDLPAGMPKPLLHQLKAVEISGHRLNISVLGTGTEHHDQRPLKGASSSTSGTGSHPAQKPATTLRDKRTPGSAKAHRKGHKPG